MIFKKKTITKPMHSKLKNNLTPPSFERTQKQKSLHKQVKTAVYEFLSVFFLTHNHNPTKTKVGGDERDSSAFFY